MSVLSVFISSLGYCLHFTLGNHLSGLDFVIPLSMYTVDIKASHI